MDAIRAANGPLSFLKRHLSQARSKFNRKQRTYIVPTIFGLIFGLLCFVLLLIALSYANNLLYLIVFFLISVALVSMLQTNNNVDSIYLLKVDPMDCYAKTKGELAVLLENTDSRNCYNIEIYIKDEKPVRHNFLPKEKKQLTLSWQAKDRGEVPAPIIYIASTFPFGLLRSWKKVQLDTKLLIYPQKINFMETTKVHRPQNEQPDEAGLFRELREYQKGDSPHRINWLSSLRHQKLLIRNYDQESAEPQIIFSWEQTSPLSHVEQRLSQLSQWLCEAERLNQNFCLLMPNFDSGLAKGRTHLRKCLNILARHENDVT